MTGHNSVRWPAVWRLATVAALALLTLASAVGVLLAPVVADDPVVSWPAAGEQPRSTVLPLAPYRPLSLDATVPCTALAALDQRPSGGDALRTMRPGPDAAQGLTVSVADGAVRMSASGEALLRETLPGPGCRYRVAADADGITVSREDGDRSTALIERQLPVPQVNRLATDLEGTPEALGLAVTLHTDARYESSPTPLKTGLLVAHGAALVALLVLAWRWSGVRPARRPVGRRVAPNAADAVLLGVSLVWVLLAPVNFDDPWYLLMSRGAAESGSVGNAIYMFNVTENPFVASQYVMQLWGALGGWGLAWMRLVPLAYGLVTWVLLRALLVRVLGPDRGGDRRAVWALLLAYLVWWLPYGMTLRPEPLIVLLSAATLLLAEVARQRRSVGVLAVAAATAALAVTVSPSGLVAAAALVLALPWLWQWLREHRGLPRVVAVLLLGAAGTALVPVGFADATLGDVLESTAVHQWYYVTFSWYEEIVHYQTVLTLPDSSQWARRAPVVLTVALLAVVAISSGRRRDDNPVWRLMVSSAVCTAIALGLLALTPTKWVNHFGAVAAAPTVLLAVALLRPPLPRGVGGMAATAGAVLLVGAVSLSFAGPNLWRPYSDRGQPFGDHLGIGYAPRDMPDVTGLRPTLGPLPLAHPLLWTGVALAAACWVWWRRSRRREVGLTPDRAVLLVGSLTLVTLTLAVFVWAPLRQYPGWTVAMTTIKALAGDSCVLADQVRVLADTPEQPQPRGSALADGAFRAAAGDPAPAPPPTPGSRVWHDRVHTGPERAGETGQAVPPGQARDPHTTPTPVAAATRAPETGTLVTPWFTLPSGEQATHLLVPLLGHRVGQQLTLEYATDRSEHPVVAGSVRLAADPTVPDTGWQQAAVALSDLTDGRAAGQSDQSDQPAGQSDRPAQQVRLVIGDRVTGPESWLAVAQPRLAAFQPLRGLTGEHSVYVDQLTATLLPCVDQVTVNHGIARAPRIRVLADEGFSRQFLDLAFEVHRGGTQVQADRSATAVRVPAEMVPSGPPTLPWGRVELVVYDHPVGLVDLRVEQEQRAGWTRLPSLATEAYNPSG